MIDTTVEAPIPLAQAADDLPERRRGRKTHVSTLFRWSTAGCRGVVLETIQVGGTRCTSREALQRFFERLSQPVQAGSAGDRQPGPLAGRRTLARRQRESAEAGRKLAELRPSSTSRPRHKRASLVGIVNSRTFRAIAAGLGLFVTILRLAGLAVAHLWRH
jgi:Protein of unknown function (DUF1580)